MHTHTRSRTVSHWLIFSPHFLLGVLVVWLLGMTQARAQTVVDWGTVATPLTSEVTFSFAQYDLNNNFTDHYNFSLEGSTGATYDVTFAFDACRNGCGSPELSYGIYDLNGSLIADASGTVTLSAGNYTFQVKGTGMGSGNSVDYFGSVTFMAATSPTTTSLNTVTMVSPAPEPSTWLLTLCGMLALLWPVWHHRQKQPLADSVWA